MSEACESSTQISNANNKLDITLAAGSDFLFKITLTDEEDAALNLTGYSARMQLRAEIDGDTADFEYEPTVGTDDSTVNVNIPNADSETMTGVYHYDIEIYTAEVVYRILQGLITIDPEVTR